MPSEIFLASASSLRTRTDDVALLDNLERVLDPLRPRHLANVDGPSMPSSSSTNAVVHERDDAAEHVRRHGVACVGVGPQVGSSCRRRAGRSFSGLNSTLTVMLSLIAITSWVIHAAPAHVGDVQEAVDAAEVDERTVLGDVLDLARHDRALAERLERDLLLLLALLLEQRATRENDVPALLVELDDLELELLPEELVEVPRRAKLEPGRTP